MHKQEDRRPCKLQCQKSLVVILIWFISLESMSYIFISSDTIGFGASFKEYCIFVYLYLNIDPCEPDPCYNEGKCKTEETGYTCQCLLGYHGSQCEIGKLW